MFDITRKHFILKQSSGKTLDIFHRDSAGICISSMNRKKLWNAPSVIMKNAAPEFSACLDDRDCIHILCQDNKGAKTYIHYDNMGWKSTPIHVGKNTAHGVRQLWIGSSGKSIHLFYTVDYPGSCFLYYQAGSQDGNLQEPQVFDSIPEAAPAFIPFIDDTGSPGVFYIQKSQSGKALGFRTFNSAAGLWGDFILFKEEPERKKLEATAACFDQNGSLHLLWDERESTNHILCHSVRYSKENRWDRTEPIAISGQPFTNSSLAAIDSRIIVYWIIEGRILYRITSNNGFTWSKSAEYAIPEGRQIYCMVYSSNEQEKPLQGLCLPGSYTNGCSLAFLNAWENSVPVIEAPTVQANSIITPVVPEVEANTTLDEKIARIAAGFDEKVGQLASEMEKLDVRQALFEAEIAKLKAGLEAVSRKIGDMEKSRQTGQEDTGEAPKNAPAQQNVHLMPGTGFSFITPEYLKNLKSQK